MRAGSTRRRSTVTSVYRRGGWPVSAYETGAEWFGPTRGAQGLTAPEGLRRLSEMPSACERCGPGRPVRVLGDDGVMRAVCSLCRDETRREWGRQSLEHAAAAERTRLLEEADLRGEALDRTIELGLRALRVVGYAAVFDQPRVRRDGYTEVVMPGAFTRSRWAWWSCA